MVFVGFRARLPQPRLQVQLPQGRWGSTRPRGRPSRIPFLPVLGVCTFTPDTVPSGLNPSAPRRAAFPAGTPPCRLPRTDWGAQKGALPQSGGQKVKIKGSPRPLPLCSPSFTLQVSVSKYPSSSKNNAASHIELRPTPAPYGLLLT